MTPDRVRELIDAYGALEHRWPAGERARAAALVAGAVSLLAYQQEAASLDQLLDQAPQSDIPDYLVDSILANAARRRARTSTADVRHHGFIAKVRGVFDQILPDVPLWQPAVGFAASLAMGVWVGALDLVPLSQQSLETETAFYETDDRDVLSLIYGGEIGFGDWANDG